MTPVEVQKAGEELARRTRKTQGLPATVRDQGVARAVAALMVQKAAT